VFEVLVFACALVGRFDFLLAGWLVAGLLFLSWLLMVFSFHTQGFLVCCGWVRSLM